MVSVSVRPITSPRCQPKLISACGFHSMITPSASMVTTASSAASMISRVRSSLARNASSERLRSVMSVEMPNTPSTRPSRSRSGHFTDR